MKKRYIVSAVLLVLAITLTLAFFIRREAFSDKSAQAFGKDYARIALYYSSDTALDKEGINAIRVGVDNKLLADSHTSDGRLWYDVYTAFTTSSVAHATENTSFTADVIVAGGDWFKLNDFEYLYGTPFYSDDNLSDRIVIDERTSFKLFGSANTVGMPLLVDGRVCFVAGVFKSPVTTAWETQFEERPVIILPESFREDVRYTVYEMVLPNPVTSYALETVKSVAGDKVLSVDVSSRYSFKNLFTVLKNFETRSYVTDPVAYPYNENLSRSHENSLAFNLLGAAVLTCAWLGTVIYIIIRRKR